MRSRCVFAALALVASGEAVAQSTLNHVVVPPAAGVVIPSRGAGGPRMGAAPGGASAVISRTAPLPFATSPTVLPGTGLVAPGIAALVLPAVAAAFLGGRTAGSGGGSTASAPARTR